MKSRVITVVVRMPEDEAGKAVVNGAIKALEPYQTGMSMEDEMTILELIEGHDDFDPSIAEEARAKALEIHAAWVASAQGVSRPTFAATSTDDIAGASKGTVDAVLSNCTTNIFLQPAN